MCQVKSNFRLFSRFKHSLILQERKVKVKSVSEAKGESRWIARLYVFVFRESLKVWEKNVQKFQKSWERSSRIWKCDDFYRLSSPSDHFWHKNLSKILFYYDFFIFLDKQRGNNPDEFMKKGSNGERERKALEWWWWSLGSKRFGLTIRFRIARLKGFVTAGI